MHRYPDDFDNPRYQAYRPRGVAWSLFGRAFIRLFIPLILIGVVGAGFLIALLIFPSEPQIIVVTANATATPLGDIMGGYPPDVRQLSIIIPSKIDNEFALNGRRGYRFFVQPGLGWEIEVASENRLRTRITLYNPDGTIAQIQDASGTNNTITFNATQTAQYGILLEAINGTAGGYTLQIMPIN